jgi:hypothetical protein
MSQNKIGHHRSIHGSISFDASGQALVQTENPRLREYGIRSPLGMEACPELVEGDERHFLRGDQSLPPASLRSVSWTRER